MPSLFLAVLIWGSFPFIAIFLFQAIHNLFFSQLRNIPGPFLAKITPRWLFVVELAGRRAAVVDKLHQQYGSAVRIAPNEVSFSDIESVKQLYGPSPIFIKAPIYEGLSLKPVGIFSLRDRAAYSQRKRQLSHVFAQSHLLDAQPLFLNHIRRLVDRFKKECDRPVDVLNLFRLVAFDITVELFLGSDQQAVLKDRPPQFLHDMDAHFVLMALENNFSWMYAIMTRLPIKKLKHFLNARYRLADFGRTNFEAYIDQYGRDSGRKDLLTKMISVKPEAGVVALTDAQMAVEIQGLVFAATDTTSMTLVYLFWELARHPTWQTRVREELIARCSSSHNNLARFSEIDDLPVLDAVIKETLRLHPSVPAGLWRETPVGGKELAGHFIPYKTVVSAQCFTTHRDPTAFPNPDAFDPSRWMEPNVVTDDMKELFMPFSQGARACIGKNQAMMNLKLISAALLRSFDVKTAPSATEDCMIMIDHFLVVPKGGKCELIFSPIS